MRRAARHTATAVVLLSASLGCRAAEQCKDCGTLVAVITADADVLVPSFSQNTIGQQIGDQLFLKLADLGMDINTLGDSGFTPRLARSWKFEDPVTLSFELDPRAHWQDGTPVTAADVVYTFEVTRDPRANASAREQLADIASVTARDEHTAVFKFRRHYVQQFYDATHHMRILPKHLLDSIPNQRLASHAFMRNPVGDGPYRLVSWKPGESVELAADTAFFLGRPGLSRLIWRIAANPQTAITTLTSGEADFMEYLGPPENVERVRAVPRLRIEKYMSPTYTYLGLNLWDPKNLKNPHPVFGDRELRRALTQAVDRRGIVEAILGEYGKFALGPINRMIPEGNDSTLPELRYDTTAARASLDRLGWKDTNGDGVREKNGHPLKFEVITPISSVTRQRAAVMIHDQLKRIGADVTLSTIELNEYISRQRTRKFDAAIITWQDDPSPSSIRQTFSARAIGDVNYVGYANPRFDQLIDQAIAAGDAGTARARYHEAFSLIIEDAPGIWLWNTIIPAAIDQRYENVRIRPDQWSALLETWRVKPGQATDRDRIALGAPR